MEENNRLIAEFMGAVYFWNGYDLFTVPELNPVFIDIDGHEVNDKHYFKPDEMRFHTSWDWIMPVVNKIETLPNELCAKYFWPTENWDKQQEDFRIFRIQKIEDLHRQVVNFIKWYNEQNK